MNPNDFRRTKENPGLMIYPSDMLSKREYRMMGVDERALLYSITLECWVNGSVPSDPEQLKIIVGLDLDVVRRGLTENLLHFLDELDGEFTMPDVERYREEVEERRRKQSQGRKKGTAIRYAKPVNDGVPHQQIIELFHAVLPELPAVRGWTDARKKLLRARWEEEPKRQNVDWWKRFFEYIAGSDYLCGRSTSWKADLPWILKQENFLKVIEGRYHADETP